jgi:hypothetical protein
MFFFPLFTHCSAHVSTLVIVLSGRPRERIGKWETCPILREQIAGARLTGVPRATVSEVMSAYRNHGKTSAKRNRKRWPYIEKDCFKKGTELPQHR